jgi:signal-transduction protein with cAMP-binding, CBS, and nucleotidyltransferase domain
MTANPVALPPNAPVERAATLLRDSRIRRLPVVEEHRPVGMVTLDDIARQWDNDASILLMVRRVAPKGHQRSPAA